MQDQPDGAPFSESNLDSPEYRERLMRKLNCLIAVLEVAKAKVRRALAGPAPDVERLTRIKKNLKDTLDVCVRARTALERKGQLPQGLSVDLAKAVDPDAIGADVLRAAKRSESLRGAQVEMGSKAELQRFRDLGKIQDDELEEVDLDDLTRRLQA